MPHDGLVRTAGTGATVLDRLMYAALARLAVRRRRLVVLAFALMVMAVAPAAVAVVDRLQSQGYNDPGAESTFAATRIIEEFGAEEPFAVLVIDSAAGVDSAMVVARARDLERSVSEQEGVSSVVSYWSTGQQSLRSLDGQAGMLLAYARDLEQDRIDALGREFTRSYQSRDDGITVHVGGWAAISHAITSTITSDLARAEVIAVPVTLVLLVFVFGSLVAAGLPLLIGAAAIVGALSVLFAVTWFTDVSVFALNLVTGFGLGLGIDYSLLIINRYREELKRGRDLEDAIVTALSTAGRTVTVSGLTVAITLGSLFVFPMYFLKSFAFAGISVVAMTVIGSLTVLPAVLAWLGPRVDAGRVLRGDLAPRDDGWWSRIARFVMRRPLPVLLITTTMLIALAAPALDAQFNQVDSRVLPASDPVAAASRVIAERFDGNESTPIEIVLPTRDEATAREYARALSGVEGVVRVHTAAGILIDGRTVAPNPLTTGYLVPDAQRIVAISDVPPRTPAGQDLIERIRGLPAPTGTLVGGAAAAYADAQDALAEHLPLAMALIAGATMLVLFLFTGSVVLPVKAVLMNLLSLSATLGLLVLVFQQGHLRWLVGDFTLTGSLDTATLILIAVVAFGLSMDYELFLLSRIKEEHDAGRDTQEAVALGLQRSGRIITAAALLLAVVFATFISAGVTSIKMMGLGVAFAILLDASIVRGLLVPAFMRVAGRWNWWAPGPLRALHRRIGLAD